MPARIPYSSANLIHLATGFKIDLFVQGDSPYGCRRRSARLE
jgi:hypothetical protein